jgi:hypothetical protein
MVALYSSHTDSVETSLLRCAESGSSTGQCADHCALI